MSHESPNRFPVVGIQHRTDLRPLDEDHIRFEIDMCIGCDRCLVACPLPSSSVVKIADLNLATISDTITPQVADFTHECVMCGSCVPVCPVNNHRDLLMLSLKQRLGVAWDGTVDMGHVLDYLPLGWNQALLFSRLLEFPAFQTVPDNYLFHFLASSKLLPLTPGSVILREGAYERDIFLLLEGWLSIASLGPDGTEIPVALMRRGEFLGEYGMLTGLPSPVTARAHTDALVLSVPEQVMQHLMELVPEVRSSFERIHHARSVEVIMKRLALFQGVADADLRELSRRVQIYTYDRGEPIFIEHGGEPSSASPPEALYLILEGFVKVARRTHWTTSTSTTGRAQSQGDERIIAYRQGGDYFISGRDPLGDGRAVAVTSINRTRVAVLSRQDIQIIFSQYAQVQHRFLGRLQEYREAADAAQSFIGTMDFLRSGPTQALSDPEARAGLRSLVGSGVVEGTEVLVIDLDKCVHCNKCEEACERRHEHSRMNRKGMVIGNISIATACRQCLDPVCMLCSRAGIARMPSGEVYITENCIGCGICAERCPYDNISIVSLMEKPEKNDSPWQRFSHFLAKGASKERGKKLLPMLNPAAADASHSKLSPHSSESFPDIIEEIRKKVAIKCDLCAGYNNQACVQACPTGAAFRTHPAQFFGSTEDILSQRSHS